MAANNVLLWVITPLVCAVALLLAAWRIALLYRPTGVPWWKRKRIIAPIVLAVAALAFAFKAWTAWAPLNLSHDQLNSLDFAGLRIYQQQVSDAAGAYTPWGVAIVLLTVVTLGAVIISITNDPPVPKQDNDEENPPPE
ncbi:MAG TPA: hypothetical protein VJR48_08680 [Ktedonobacterales bacterium]|nr:hypothetical protein [Ktedonobacterales bacterium]